MCETTNMQKLWKSFAQRRHSKMASSALGSMLEASFDAGFLVTRSGNVEHFNRAAKKIFEINGDPSLRKVSNPLHISSYVTIVEREESIPWHDFLTKFERNRDRTWRSLGWRAGGEHFAAQVQCAVVRDDGISDPLLVLYIRKVEAVQQSSEHFTSLLHELSETSSEPVIFVNEKARIQLVNKGATEELGYTKQDLVGNSIDMIVGGENGTEQTSILRQYLESHETGQPLKVEFIGRRKNGSTFAAEIFLRDVLTTDGRQLFCGYLHQRPAADSQSEQVKRQEEITSKIIDASHTAIFVANRDGRIVRVNAAAVRKFECDKDILCSKTMSDFLSPKDGAILAHEIEQFLTVGIPPTPNQEVEAVTEMGVVFPASMAIATLEGNDSFVIYIQDITAQKNLTKVEVDKAAAEMLLSNMLPDQIVTQLKKNPSHIAEHHDDAVVLFADIVGFTTMSSQMSPQEVVSMLNILFSSFDALVEKYELNKIKTIGDCYMVSSVPVVSHADNCCSRVCYLALDMLDAIVKFNENHPGYNLNLRIGINNGPAMAGVVGATRFLYDIWGDSVNLASRMESTGVSGKIQVTESVVKSTKGWFAFQRRGVIEVKGKGKIETYFLKSMIRRPSLRRISTTKTVRAQMRRASVGLKYESFTELLNSLADVTTVDRQDGDAQDDLPKLYATAATTA